MIEKLQKSLSKHPSIQDFSLEYSDFILATIDTKQAFTDDLLHDVYYQLINVRFLNRIQKLAIM